MSVGGRIPIRYGKLHGLTGRSGVFHSYDITAANVHDINYLDDIKPEYHDCDFLYTLGDKRDKDKRDNKRFQHDLLFSSLIKLLIIYY